MIVLVFIFCLALALGPAARADDGAVRGVGGAVQLMQGHPSVRMVSEVVRIQVPEARVSARFVFHNDGPPVTVEMGFPEEGGGDIALLDTHFQGFRSYVDGKRVAVRRVVASQGNSYRYWWVKRVRFGRGQTRVVENRYIGGQGGMSSGDRWFNYILQSGASWKGPIGRARIICDIRGLRDFADLKFSPAGYRQRGHLLVWDLKNIEPTEDIHIAWFPYFSNIVINGQRVGGRWNYPWSDGLAQRRGHEVWMSLRNLAQWLGAEIQVGAPGQPVRLVRGERWLEVANGSRWMRARQGRVTLPARVYMELRVEQERLIVPLTPVVRALGGKAYFDRKTGKMMVWIKPPQPGAPLPTAPKRGKIPAANDRRKTIDAKGTGHG
jgi:hypothetical protein